MTWRLRSDDGDLIFWKVVKLSVEDAVRPQLQDEDQISRLPMLKLSRFFSDLNEERLHVVIQPPPLGELSVNTANLSSILMVV